MKLTWLAGIWTLGCIAYWRFQIEIFQFPSYVINKSVYREEDFTPFFVPGSKSTSDIGHLFFFFPALSSWKENTKSHRRGSSWWKYSHTAHPKKTKLAIKKSRNILFPKPFLGSCVWLVGYFVGVYYMSTLRCVFFSNMSTWIWSHHFR